MKDLVRQAMLWDETICLDCDDLDTIWPTVACRECGSSNVLRASVAQALIERLEKEEELK